MFHRAVQCPGWSRWSNNNIYRSINNVLFSFLLRSVRSTGIVSFYILSLRKNVREHIMLMFYKYICVYTFIRILPSLIY